MRTGNGEENVEIIINRSNINEVTINSCTLKTDMPPNALTKSDDLLYVKRKVETMEEVRNP